MVLRPSRLLLGTNYVGKHRRVSRVSGEPETKPETKHDPGPGPGPKTKRRRSQNQRNFKTKQTLSVGGRTVCLLVRSSVSACLCDCPLARMPFRLALISKSSACEGYQWHFRCEPPRFAAPFTPTISAIYILSCRCRRCRELLSKVPLRSQMKLPENVTVAVSFPCLHASMPNVL